MTSKAKLTITITLAAVLILLAGCAPSAAAFWPQPEALQVDAAVVDVELPEIPEPEPEPEPEEVFPDVSPGAIDEDEERYANECLGLRFTLPEGWQFADQEIIDKMMGAGVELISENGGYLDTAGISAIYDMVAYNANTDSNIMVMIEALTLEPYTELPTAMVHLEALQERLEEMDVFGFVFGRLFATTVSGEIFHVLPVTVDVNETQTRQYYLVRIHGRHMVTIIATLFDDITIGELLVYFGQEARL